MTAITQALSVALFHFIWQGTLVAFLLWIALAMLRTRTANARYLASCAALALMAALPAITAWMLNARPGVLEISAAAPTAATAAVAMSHLARGSEWRQWVLPAWSLGVLVFALRLVIGCRQVAALRRLGQAADRQIADTVSALARRMKAKRAIRVLISAAAECPSVVGWLRPVILLPAATLAGLKPEQLQAVLAHEIAHIRRHDYLVNLAQNLVETLLFYHPAVWWASARIRHERELCCDDAAVAVCGNAIAYARALTSLERLRMAPGLTLGSNGGSLLYRIERLAGVSREMGRSKLPGIAALALSAACFAATVHWANAQQMTRQPAIAREVGITVSTTGALLHRSRVPYPEAVAKNGSQGTVLLEAMLDRSGNVADARVVSGPPELRKAALQSVLQWQFANAWAGETQQVSIAFEDAQAAMRQTSLERETTALAQEALRLQTEQEALRKQVLPTETQLAQLNRQLAESRMSLSDENPKMAALENQIAALKEQIATIKQANGQLAIDRGMDRGDHSLESQYAELQRKLAAASEALTAQHPEIVFLRAQIEALRGRMKASSASFVGAPLARIDIVGVTDSQRAELAARLNINVGEILTQDSIDSALNAVHGFDERLQCEFLRDGNGGVELRISGLGEGRGRN